jgi:endonuclease/exonuclease/phosphatase family metal-dependent hydrolase
MPVRIFKFGIKKMSLRGKFFAYLTIFFNFLLFFSYLAYLSDPSKAVWIAFMGLAYPSLILINIFLCVVWLLKRKLFFLPSLLIIIMGMYHHSRFFQINSFAYIQKSEKTLNVMSYNVRLFDLYNWTENTEIKEKIINLVRSQNPDIICFQEYYFDKTNGFITRDLIIKELGFKYYHESFSDESKNNSFFGLATFSKFPIVNKENLQFNNDNSNQCIWSDVVKGNDTLRIFNTHIGSIRFNHSDYNIIGGKGSPIWPHEKVPEQDVINRLKKGFSKRAYQVAQIIPIINQSPYKKIICCDLNDTPISYAYNKFDKYLKDAFTYSGIGLGGTYIGKVPGLRIDYIWHDKELSSSKFMTHQEEFSDHKAISADIFIP